MDKVAGFKGFLILLVLLGFLADFGCSRQVGVPAGEGTEPATQTPFHDDSAVSPNLADSSSFAANHPESGSGLPFHDAQSLPAGTLLMVRLKASVSTARPQSTDSFEATLDAPVMVEGNVLIPRGSDAVGRIESARTSQMKPGRGYIQLALQSIRVGGVDVPVQTASLFVRQPPKSPKDSSLPAIRLEKGHRLTFRLIQPLYAANQSPQITR
ncbi:MAG: hypothetical protein ACRD3B_03230 [Candidatus Sulfotelmatobacter sp.]